MKKQKVGLVLDGRAMSDAELAAGVTKCGRPMTAAQIRKARRMLARLGLIAVDELSPGKYRILVMNSDKFPDQQAQPYPKWAEDAVTKTILHQEGLANRN